MSKSHLSDLTSELNRILLVSDEKNKNLLITNFLNTKIYVLDKNDVTTTYDTIDLYDLNGAAFSDVTDLSWSVYADDLTIDSEAMGESTDRLIDGVWTITYTLQDADDAEATGTVATYEAEVLVDGDVRADVYDALREIPKQYDDNINDHIDDIMEALLKASYLRAINASASVSEKDSIINMLWTLDKLNSDGSKYDW